MFGQWRLGYWWLFAIIGFELVLGATLGRAPVGEVFALKGLATMLPGWVLIPLLWFGYLAILITWRRMDRPIAVLRRLTYLHRNWLLRGLLLIALVFPLSKAFASYKDAIPTIIPFYADPHFITIDHMIFGMDAWRITHAFIGPMGTVIIDRLYFLWFTIMMLLIGYFCFTRDQKLQIRGLLTYLLTWQLLGNVAATAFSSVGPCFYAEFYSNSRFQPLMDSLHTTAAENPLFALGAMDYLLKSVGTARLGTGISAMPSLHVGIAFLLLLVTLGNTRRLWPKLLSAAYALVVLVGSVHLGWHYAVDGIVSIIGVTMIWVISGRFVDWVEARQMHEHAHAFDRHVPSNDIS